MISSDEYTCAGKVTDVRVEGSLLGLRATIPFLVYCTTLHHIGADSKWKSRLYLSSHYKRKISENNRGFDTFLVFKATCGALAGEKTA